MEFNASAHRYVKMKTQCVKMHNISAESASTAIREIKRTKTFDC